MNALDALMQFFSLLGVSIIFWACIALLVFVYEEYRNHRFILYVVLTAATVWVVTWVMKLLIARPRPSVNAFCPTDFSFPSQHAAMAFAAATILTMVDRKRWWLYFIVAGLIAVSRVYLECHYVSDVVAGALIGTAIAAAIVRIVPSGKSPSLGPRGKKQ